MTDPATPPEQPPPDPAASTVENTPAEKPWTPEAWTPEPWTPATPAIPEAPSASATEAATPEPTPTPALEAPNPYSPPVAMSSAGMPPAPAYNPGYQQPYGSPYAQPAYGGYGYVPPTQQELRQQRNGLAIGALVCSLIGIFTCGLASIAGLIMGHISYSQAKRGQAGGQGLALAAVIIGYVVLALWAGFIVTAFLTDLFQAVNDH